MSAHLVTPRRQIADRKDPQALEQASRLDSQCRTKIFKTENVCAPDPDPAAFEPVLDLYEVTAPLSVFLVRVSQVTSNCVFQNRQQQFQLALDYMISPDQVGVLSGQQKSGVG